LLVVVAFVASGPKQDFGLVAQDHYFEELDYSRLMAISVDFDCLYWIAFVHVVKLLRQPPVLHLALETAVVAVVVVVVVAEAPVRDLVVALFSDFAVGAVVYYYYYC
jgi:hypothetical protein